MPLSVGATLGKVAKGEFHDLTRDELHGLTNGRFLREHRVDPAFSVATAEYVQHAVRSRNSTHPHVKRLGLSPIMTAHNDALKSLYQDVCSKIIRYFEQHVHGKRKDMAHADEEDDTEEFEVPDIEREAFLSNVAATLKSSKNPFRNLSAKYTKDAYRAGHKAGSRKVTEDLMRQPAELDEEDENNVTSGYVDSNSNYYDGLLDDMHDDVAKTFDERAATKDDFVTALAAGLMGQFHRTDLFTSDLYRVAQDGQLNAYGDAEDKDNAGQEWKYKWKAIIDNITCEQCIELNEEGPKYLDEFEYDPGDVHLFCRCDIDPVPPDEYGEDGEKDGGGAGPDGESPDLFDNPNNTGFNPDAEPTDEYSEKSLFEVPRDDAHAEELLRSLNQDHVIKYIDKTSFLEKVEDLQKGNLVGLHMKDMANLTKRHFNTKHEVGIKGAWENREWWNRLKDAKTLKNEIDMLGRVDAHMDVFNKLPAVQKMRSVYGRDLSFSRDLNRPRNGGFFDPKDRSIHLHNGSLDARIDWKNQTIAHEIGHWMDFGMMQQPVWGKVIEGEWSAITQKGMRKKEQAYVSDYAKRGRTKYRNDQSYWYVEDVAEGVANYIHNPGMFKGSETLKKKYELLKEHMFGGAEFTPDSGKFKSLF